jgi:hypothetical protein
MLRKIGIGVPHLTAEQRMTLAVLEQQESDSARQRGSPISPAPGTTPLAKSHRKGSIIRNRASLNLIVFRGTMFRILHDLSAFASGIYTPNHVGEKITAANSALLALCLGPRGSVLANLVGSGIA